MSVVEFRRREVALDDEAPDRHLVGTARCLQCRTEWEAVAPIGVKWLDCPVCNAEKGYMIGPVLPKIGEMLWYCACGGDIFYITRRDGPCCHLCGVPATGWFK